MSVEPPASADAATSPFKSHGGVRRVFAAMGYSLAGLRAALRHESAFRQELAIGIPALIALPWIAPGRWQGLLMAACVVGVWIVELLNSALEALADAISVEPHPLIGRAKDIGSAAVMLSLLLSGVVWVTLLWP